VKIQIVGSIRSDDDVVVADGSLDERRFVALFGRDGRLVGALGFSRPRLLMQYRRMIAERASWDDALARAAQE
jgi:3-phenylpropionate/trans-cinnamate dioxygenase ferredoxin reductase component